MGRFSGLALVLTLVLVFRGSGRAAAQQTPPVSPTLALLQQYVVPASAIPAGFVPLSLDEVSNVELALELREPAVIQSLVSSGRTGGLEQELGGASGTSARILVDVSLFSDSAAAQADLAESAGGPGATLSPNLPPLGDTSIAASLSAFSGGSPEPAQLVGFTSGRLEVLVTGFSLSSGQIPDVQLTASSVARAATNQPPPAPLPTELALLQTQTSPEAILYDAYRVLIDKYLTSLSPSAVLSSAYAGATGALTAAGVANVPAPPQITSADADSAWAQFLPGFRALEALAGSLSPRALAYAAATAMYGDLNCHTEFFTPTAYVRELDAVSGSPYVGIGVTLSPGPPELVLKVEPGSPAQQAGLLPGDQIVAVNQTQLAELSESAASALFGGAAGTPITLTIARAGGQSPFDVTMRTQPITPLIEQHKVLPGGIGYIELDQFVDGQKAVDGVRSALQDFAAAGTVNSWILDLRFDGGGSELTMQRIASLFVPAGSLIDSDVQRDGTQTTLQSSGGPVAGPKPLVILVGPSTASAAEIFTEALRDLGRASVIGSQTAGCVNGGQILGLLDGSGVFVSTEQLFSGPRQVALEGVGVTPDQRVDFSLSEFAAGHDTQLAAAIAALSAPPPAH